MRRPGNWEVAPWFIWTMRLMWPRADVMDRR